MVDFAARSPSRMMRAISSARVMMSLKVSVPVARRRNPPDFVFERIDAQGVLDRDLQAFGADRLDDEIDGARPHGRNDRLDRAMRRLDDDRHADLALAQTSQHAHAVEIGHDEVENQQIDGRLVGALEPRQAPPRRHRPFRLIAETARPWLREGGVELDRRRQSEWSLSCFPRGAVVMRSLRRACSGIRVNFVLKPVPNQDTSWNRASPRLARDRREGPDVRL